MKQPILVFGGGLLVVATLLVISQMGRTGDEEVREANSKSQRSAAPGSQGAPPLRETITLSPDEAARKLRALLDAKSDKAGLGFEEIEALARRVTDADLEAIIHTIRFTDETGREGWLRCALFAEWGRRDAAAAIKYMDEVIDGEDRKYAIQQAWFSIYRGFAERDPHGALELRREVSLLQSGDRVTTYVTTAIFRELAREDPESAWAALLEEDRGLGNAEVLKGFFRGLQSAEEAQDYLGKWHELRWDTEEATKAFEDYNREAQNSALSGIVAMPAEESIVVEAATAWARHDLAAAMDWLRNHGPGGERAREWRVGQALREWTRDNSGAALELLEDERFATQQSALGQGIIESDPARAVEVLSRIENHSARASALMSAISGSANNHVDDFFPSPGQNNRLADLEHRYQQLLEAVDQGNFTNHQQRALYQNVHREFQAYVPAAKAATDAINSAP